MSGGHEQVGVVVRDLEDGIVQWELSNPRRRNAVGPEALHWIARASRELSGQVVLLTGSGREAFCAGFDLTSLEVAPGSEPPDGPLMEATQAMVHANATFVAVINGYAIGAGVELACACDLRIASDLAWFQVPAGRLGVVYHADGLARMRATFGPTLTRRLVLLGDRVDAREAEASGAFARCVPAVDLETTSRAVATALRATAPLALRGNRDLLRRLDVETVGPGNRSIHGRARAAAYRSEDHREARRAVAERRSPRFRGR